MWKMIILYQKNGGVKVCDFLKNIGGKMIISFLQHYLLCVSLGKRIKIQNENW